MTAAVGATQPTASSTQSSITGASKSLAGDQQTFLTLLTTQLKNQDPLSPLDANQFTAQLVAMTGVQQQIVGNQLLQQMVNRQTGLGDPVNMIGKTVTAATAAATLKDGKTSWTYSVTGDAADVSVQIVDNLGNVVGQSDLGHMAQGEHTFDWDGKGLSGNPLPDGATYGLVVTAKDAAGAAINSSVYQRGLVTSVQQDPQAGSLISINGTLIPASAVTIIAAAS